MSAPRVSVIIGTYNCEEFIGRTVTSVLEQSLREWELLIVDDRSTDGTLDEIARFHDPRIRVIRRAANSGLPAVPRNEGLRQARGRYAAFLDHDDVWYPKKLEIQAGYLDSNPHIALAGSLMVTYDHGAGTYGKVVPGGRGAREGRIYDDLLMSNFLACSSVMAGKRALEEEGYFDESPSMAAAEDWDLWLRVSRTRQAAVIPRVLGEYSVHRSNLSSGQRQLESVSNVIDKHLGRGWISEDRAGAAKGAFYARGGFSAMADDPAAARAFFRAAGSYARTPRGLLVSGGGVMLSMIPGAGRVLMNARDRWARRVRNG